MKNKKLIATALVATLALGLFAGCGGNKDAASQSSASSAATEASSDSKTITIGASPSPHAENSPIMYNQTKRLMPAIWMLTTSNTLHTSKTSVKKMVPSSLAQVLFTTNQWVSSPNP